MQDKKVGTNGKQTRVNWLSFNTRSPAASMVTSSYFQEFRRNLDVVEAVFDDLYPSFSGIILCPRITV